MANNPEKSPKANVFGTAAKQAKAAPKAAKEKTVNVEARKQASPDERTPTADKPSLKTHPPSPATAKRGPLSPFEQRQREKLLALKDTLLDSMNGVAKDSLR